MDPYRFHHQDGSLRTPLDAETVVNRGLVGGSLSEPTPPSAPSGRKRRVREGHPCPHGCEGGKGFRPLILHFAKQHLKLSAADLEASKEQERCMECNLHMRRLLVPVHKFLFHHIEFPPNWALRYEAIEADPFHVDLSKYPVGELEGAPLVVRSGDWAEYVSEPEEEDQGRLLYSEGEEEFVGVGDEVNQEMYMESQLDKLQSQVRWLEKEEQTRWLEEEEGEEGSSPILAADTPPQSQQEELRGPSNEQRFQELWETLDFLAQISPEERLAMEGVKFKDPNWIIRLPEGQKPSSLEELWKWAEGWTEHYGLTSHIHFLVGHSREVLVVANWDHPDFNPQFKLEKEEETNESL